jgi:hypothetical protein
MVPIVGAITDGLEREKESSAASKEIEKLLSNIGRILARQMTLASLRRKRQILPLGRKGECLGPLPQLPIHIKVLKYIGNFFEGRVARSLLTLRPEFHRERPARG